MLINHGTTWTKQVLLTQTLHIVWGTALRVFKLVQGGAPTSLQYKYPRDPGSPKLRMVMEPKYLAEEVIVHPNHHLTRWLDP